MAYNKELLQKQLSGITANLFRAAIYLCYRDGITTVAPLARSGDNILLFGEERNADTGTRKSYISIRNYRGDAELLITDVKGNFLFYGRFDINMGVDFVARQYWNIFKLVKFDIERELEVISDFANIPEAANCTITEGFKMLEYYQISQRNSLLV